MTSSGLMCFECLGREAASPSLFCLDCLSRASKRLTFDGRTVSASEISKMMTRIRAHESEDEPQ